jgi:hypothetical protein
MMTTFLRTLAPITGLLLATLAAAEPFNSAWVSADARWVAHIDVDRAREAEGLRRLLRGHVELDEGDVERLQRKLDVQIAGLDADDFSFICAYGTGDGQSETAVIGASPRAVEWFVNWMSRAGEAQDDQQAQQWSVRSWRRHDRLTAMTTIDLPGGGSAMVIADSIEEVVSGAQVVSGEAPSLASVDDSPLRARPALGSVVFVAAEGLDEFEGLRPRAVALRDAKGLVLDFGEGAERMFLEARVMAADPEHAMRTRDVLGGLRAWGRMAIAQSGRASRCADLLDALELQVDGVEVVVSWSAAAASLPEAPEPAEAPSP